jgi:superfamily I DNA/RNA helicase
MQFTPEQQAILDTNSNLVINAVAGSGKTTTLIAYAASRPAAASILYLAFNKTVKSEAEKKFNAAGLKNVTVETAHSLAFKHVMRYSSYTLAQDFRSFEIAQLLGIASGDRHVDLIIANHVLRFVSYFCNSKARKVQDLSYIDVITDAKAKAFVKHHYTLIESFTRALLAKMDKGEIGITHDFYLKKFQLSNPALHYDYILFDEGQDASGAMLDVFLNQPAIKVIVGDAHQQIYGWRYAVNSLQQVDFPVYHLSNSFRFDDEVAMVANKILAWKKHLLLPPAVKIIGAGKAADFIHTKATIGRTNLALLIEAIALREKGEIVSVYFEGNINSYTFADEGASLYDILNLYNGKLSSIKDKLIAEMKSMQELEEYISKTEDTSMSLIVEVVKEFGNKLPALISQLKAAHTATKEEADMIFSTVHRCKGMEYDQVSLINDFINEDKLEKAVVMAGAEPDPGTKNKLTEEINILYVAVTRAKSMLIIPEEINPLKSVKVAQKEKAPVKQPPRNSSLASRMEAALYKDKFIYSKGNYGKRWTDDEEDTLRDLYLQGTDLKKIARQLERGETGVKMKLASLGLLSL